MRRGAECGTRLFREEQIPLCIPRPPKCGGKEKAQDSVRDDPRLSFAADCKSSGLRKAVALARNQQLRPTKSARRITDALGRHLHFVFVRGAQGDVVEL